MENIEIIKKLAEGVARRMNLEIFEVDFKKRKGRSLLSIVIDDPSGYVSIDQCEAFSKEISPLLDAESEMENYILEVSSPGLDRPLRKIQDFDRFNGKLVRIKFENGDEKSTVTGRIVNCDIEANTFSLDVDGTISSYDFSKIKSANLVVEF
ncbi:ribosome maturation factor RimP [Athalassotoga saccharophila]|uniref:ribosome maturation factor RimP n=1 Tax=Athalassotoga saccharophila TaxID=1441386 RepID=UPI00137A7A07|nr:ribosome maturation factor RimP [Athalassotoga saccharophila]BBJ29032.1 ribosome maturation factor RimP [Athalassotoga saccharophila]